MSCESAVVLVKSSGTRKRTYRLQTSTMSDKGTLSAPKPKGRQRASTPRSKTGCVTCKTRRLKCGEEKPECFRCKKSGWRCDGYDHGMPSNLTLLPQFLSPNISVYHHPEMLNLTAEEQKYFQVFIDQKSTDLDPRETEGPFWKQTALQECYSNPCVLHTIVAQGALAVSQASQTPWAYLYRLDAQNSHHEFALTQYEKALQALRTSIGDLQKGKGARSTLISAIALARFDFSIGNGAFAAQHVRFARRHIASWRSANNASGSNTIASRDIIDEKLIRMFRRQDINLLCFMGIDGESPYESTLVPGLPLTTMPAQFINLEDAYQVRQMLIINGYHFFLHALQYHLVPKEQIPANLYAIRKHWLDQIQFWNNAFDPVLNNYATDPKTHPFARPEAWRVPTITMFLWLIGTLQTDETAYDGLVRLFQYLTSVAEEVIEFEKTSPDLQLQAENVESYTQTALILPALYLVATKCRQYALRTHAINILLSSHRREGIWDSTLCGKVAGWLFRLEEDAGMDWDGTGTAPRKCDGFVTGDLRVWDCRVERDLFGVQGGAQGVFDPMLGGVELGMGQRKDRWTATVKCKQNLPLEIGGGWMERETVVTW